jgi:hypothetical protein
MAPALFPVSSARATIQSGDLLYLSAMEAHMFERDEVLQDLHGRLMAAGINPRDPKVQAICEVVNAFYAEKTREVLEKMQAVLAKIPT